MNTKKKSPAPRKRKVAPPRALPIDTAAEVAAFANLIDDMRIRPAELLIGVLRLARERGMDPERQSRHAALYSDLVGVLRKHGAIREDEVPAIAEELDRTDKPEATR